MTKQPYFGAIGPLTVYQAGLPMMRVGKFSDGGYVVASLGRNAYDLYLAGGVNDDTSFDLAFFQEHSIPLGYAFDGTIENAPPLPPGLAWKKENIGFGEGLNDMRDLLSGHSSVFLKMDIEGAEWDWLRQMPVEDLLRFKQMVFEFHRIGTDRYGFTPEEKIEILRKLSENFYIVWAHGNNHGGLHLVEGTAIPEGLEVTYVRKDVPDPKFVWRNTRPVPGPLDVSNRVGGVDFQLNYPPFRENAHEVPELTAMWHRRLG